MKKIKRFVEKAPIDIDKNFDYLTNAPVEILASSLASCDSYEDLHKRLRIDNYYSFLISKN